MGLVKKKCEIPVRSFPITQTMKLLATFSIILLTGATVALAAPTEAKNVSPLAFFTRLFQMIGLNNSPCDDLKCFNGGNCHEDPRLDGGAECVCPEGFDGAQCEYVDVCNNADDPKTCSDSGICRNDFSDSGYTCYCEPGFTGDDCENADPCYPNPCAHDGICLPEGDSIVCDCVDGFYGDRCEEVDACLSNPCLNGATCSLDEDNEFQCECPPGFTGDACELKVECDPALQMVECVPKITMDIMCAFVPLDSAE